jgi:preprotein translocase subunit SecF
VIGTYASIFIGTPVMYDATISQEKKKAAQKNLKGGQKRK